MLERNISERDHAAAKSCTTVDIGSQCSGEIMGREWWHGVGMVVSWWWHGGISGVLLVSVMIYFAPSFYDRAWDGDTVFVKTLFLPASSPNGIAQSVYT